MAGGTLPTRLEQRSAGAPSPNWLARPWIKRLGLAAAVGVGQSMYEIARYAETTRLSPVPAWVTSRSIYETLSDGRRPGMGDGPSL